MDITLAAEGDENNSCNARKLFLTKHALNKYCIGWNGGPAFYGVRSEFGRMEKDDIELIALMVYVFNKEIENNEEIKEHLKSNFPELWKKFFGGGKSNG